MGLDIVELVMEWEEAFSINIGDDEAATLSTPAEVCDLVEQKLQDANKSPGRDEIERLVRKITIRQLGIAPDDYRIDARFVEDFRMD